MKIHKTSKSKRFLKKGYLLLFIRSKGGTEMVNFETMKQQAFPPPDYETWKETVEKSLKGKPYEKLFSKTYEGIQLKPIYTREDLSSLEHIEQYPGFSHYVRGTSVNGYVKEPWAISQEIFAESPEQWNEIVKHDLSKGQTEIHLVLDKLPFWVNTVEDLETMFAGIPLTDYSIRIDAGDCSLPFVSLFKAFIEKHQLSFSKLRGTIGMDPLGSLIESGQTNFSLSTLYDVMADITRWSHEHFPYIKTIMIHGEPYHHAGANVVQELAFAFATAVEYIRELMARGLTIDEVAPNMSFSFAIGSHFFMEIAKLRAARLVWSNIIQAFNGNKESQKLVIHARTSYFTKTVHDPYVNMLRSTTEAFAAVVGSANSLHVSPFDEPIRPADEFSRRIARNTQLILLEESHLGKVIDPAGGSYFVETLTHQIAEEAWKLFQQIEIKGGMVQALQDGFVQTEVKKVADKRLEQVKMRNEKIVGTNFYANLAEPVMKKEKLQKERTTEVLNKDIVKQLKNEFASKRFVKPAFTMVERKASAQDIRKALHSETLIIQPLNRWRLAEPFEQLRAASLQHLEKTGSRPKVVLLNIGTIPQYKPRADFITGFFETGGFEVKSNIGREVSDETLEELVSEGTHFIICGTDDMYKDWVPNLAVKLKKEHPSIRLYVAGKQAPDIEQAFILSGIDGFIHMKSNVYETLVQFMYDMGVAIDE
jgi:methylmalonyl-CoA mutase